MVSAVNAASSAAPQPTPGPRPVDPPANDSGQYARDWSTLAPSATAAPTPGPVPGPTPTSQPQATPTAGVSGPSAVSARDAEIAQAQIHAELAEHVYGPANGPGLPPGYRVVEGGELLRLGLTPSMLEQPGSSFRARVYATGEGPDAQYVIAFRGSTPVAEDWINNITQGTAGISASYDKALFIGQRVANSDANVTMTGHSLGGGLASAAALASGRDADTFNAAGLHARTIARGDAIRVTNGQGFARPDVDAYYVPGEILSSIQDSPPFAGVDLAPSAYGDRQALPVVLPEGKSWTKLFDPMDKHGHDWIQGGLAAMRNR